MSKRASYPCAVADNYGGARCLTECVRLKHCSDERARLRRAALRDPKPGGESPRAKKSLTDRQERTLVAMWGAAWPGGTAADIAARVELPKLRRHGNGAVKGSWSGYVDPAFQLAPTLLSLEKRGLVRSYNSGRTPRVLYWTLTDEGAREADRLHRRVRGA